MYVAFVSPLAGTRGVPVAEKGLNLNTGPYGDEHTVFLECGPRQTRMPVDVFVCCINITGIFNILPFATQPYCRTLLAHFTWYTEGNQFCP